MADPQVEAFRAARHTLQQAYLNKLRHLIADYKELLPISVLREGLEDLEVELNGDEILAEVNLGNWGKRTERE